MTLKDVELQVRQDIVCDVKTSFFVEAGAGSGKTTALVNRMVSMVESGIKVNEISAITFTKAAANEFYARFQKELAKKSDDKLCADALRDIDLCFMGTIDSFCNMILSEHPSAAQIPSNTKNVSEEELIELYKIAFSEISAGLYGTELKELCENFIKFDSRPQTTFIKIVSVLMSKRNANIINTVPSKTDIDQLINVELKQAATALYALANAKDAFNEASDGARKAKANLIKCQKMLKGNLASNIPNTIRVLKDLEDLRINKDISLSSIDSNLAKFFVEHESRGKLAWYEIDKENFISKKLKNYQYAITLDFVSKSLEPIAEKLKQEGKLDFFDYILYLRDTLKEDAANGGNLIKHIYHRHKYFLIDEFQDTNPIQAEIFFYLTATKFPQTDFTKCIPHPGSLFIVGDPKQSIYRFRDADVSSFIRIRTLFENPVVGRVVELTRNFRSTNKLREFYNDEFSKLFVESKDQAAFNMIPPVTDKVDDPDAFSGVYSYTLKYYKSKEEAIKEDLDPYVVSNMILKIIKNNKLYLNKNQNIEFKDFMVLTRTTTHLQDYMKAFRENDIPFKVEGETLFNDCEAFKTAMGIIGAIAHPKERLFVYKALTNKLFNEKDDNIIGVDISVPNINSSINSLKKLSEFFELVKEKSPSAIYQKIISYFELFKHIDSANMEYLFYGLELLRSKELDGTISSIEDAYDYLDSLLDSNKEVERCMSLELNDNKVHLANVHKVKGLERPIVILADPTIVIKGPSNRMDYSNGQPDLYVFNVQNKDNFSNYIESNIYNAQVEEEKISQEAERLRLLYVAATRARNVVIVGKQYKADGSFANSLWKGIADDVNNNIETVLNGITITPSIKAGVDAKSLYNKTSVLDNKKPNDKSYEIIRPSMLAHSKVESEDIEYKPSKNTDATIKGTMVHRLMEELVSSNGTFDIKQLIDDICNEYDAEDKFKDVLISVANTVTSGGYKQINGAPEDILKELSNADEKYTEVPFAYKENNELYNGVIDLLYKKDGMWHVIDYKTNYDDTDLDNLYRKQLDSYIEAFKKVSSEEIDSKIYRIDIHN